MDEIEQWLAAQIDYCEANIAVIKDTLDHAESIGEFEAIKREFNGLLDKHHEIVALYQSTMELMTQAKEQQKELSRKLDV